VDPQLRAEPMSMKDRKDGNVGRDGKHPIA
jgi:hypothetical protein